jgi:hypothetical protein
MASRIRQAVKQSLSSVGLLEPLKEVAAYVFHPAREFKRIAKANGWSKWDELVPASEFPKTCASIITELKSEGHEFGDYLEFGVSRGSSLAHMHHALREAGLGSVRQIGFDSFEGMPKGSHKEGWGDGWFASTVPATRTYLTKRGVDLSRIELVKGWFNQTCTEETVRRLNLRKASIIMVDCDIYSATCEVLRFIPQLIDTRAAIIFDDWGWQSDKNEIGQQEAFAEFLSANPDIKASPRPDYAYIPQARIFMLSR